MSTYEETAATGAGAEGEAPAKTADCARWLCTISLCEYFVEWRFRLFELDELEAIERNHQYKCIPKGDVLVSVYE